MSLRIASALTSFRAELSHAMVVCLLLLSCNAFSAQSPNASSQKPVIRTQSSLTLVDVIAQDAKNGLPVRDLQRQDFRIFDNGQEVSMSTFDTGAGARPVIVWLTVICNEQGKEGGSANYVGNETQFRPALEHLEKNDLVGVAHWCDNGETQLDLAPAEDRDASIRALAEVIRPIPFKAGSFAADAAGEVAFRRMIRLIIQDAQRRNPQPLPVVVFLDGDHTGQPLGELKDLVGDFLETSGIVFGIKDSRYSLVLPLIGEQSQILHYMAKHTGGQYVTAMPAAYGSTLESILVQLHTRYELGFIPSAIDGKRHTLKVELTKEAGAKYKGVRLRFRPEYIPLRDKPEWAR
jgi:hypothetical protein